MRNSSSERVVYETDRAVVTFFRGEFIVYRREVGSWKPVYREQGKREAFIKASFL